MQIQKGSHHHERQSLHAPARTRRPRRRRGLLHRPQARRDASRRTRCARLRTNIHRRSPPRPRPRRARRRHRLDHHLVRRRRPRRPHPRSARDNDRWLLASKADFPAEPDRVRQLITTLSELRTVEPKTAKPELHNRLTVQWPDDAKRDPDDFSPRPTLVSITDADGEPIAEIVLGDTTYAGGGPRQYARLLDDNQSWLVAASVTLPRGPLGFVNTRFVELPRDSVRSVTVVQSDGASLRLVRDDPEEDFTLAEIPDGMAMTNQALANNTGNALAFVNFTDIEAVPQGEELDWSGMAPIGIAGILEEDQVSTYFTTFEGTSVSLIIEPIRENSTISGGWVVVGGEGEGSSEIIRNLVGYRFKLPAGTIESLTRKPSELIETPATDNTEPTTDNTPGLPPPTND